MERHKQEFKSRDEFYATPTNRRLKYVAISIISVAIAIFVALIIWYDAISPKLYLFMRGCAGLCAIVFVILVTIIVYRVNHEFINQR